MFITKDDALSQFAIANKINKLMSKQANKKKTKRQA